MSAVLSLVKRFRLPGALTALALFIGFAAAPAASAATTGGNGGTSVTQTFHGTQSFADVNPCTGNPAHLDVSTNSVNHINYSPDGDEFWATFTETDRIVSTDLVTGVVYTGEGTFWGNYNQNQRNSNTEFTGTVVVRASDGSSIKFHEVAVLTISATGLVTNNRDVISLTCT